MKSRCIWAPCRWYPLHFKPLEGWSRSCFQDVKCIVLSYSPVRVWNKILVKSKSTLLKISNSKTKFKSDLSYDTLKNGSLLTGVWVFPPHISLIIQVSSDTVSSTWRLLSANLLFTCLQCQSWLDWNQEPEIQSKSPRGWQECSDLSHLLLLPRVCISKKLESAGRAGYWTKCSSMGWGHWAKCPQHLSGFYSVYLYGA